MLAALCREHDAICVTDEVYEHLVYDGEHVPMATLPGMRERTITISSFGKTFSLTGWKIGWAAAPPELTAGRAGRAPVHHLRHGDAAAARRGRRARRRARVLRGPPRGLSRQARLSRPGARPDRVRRIPPAGTYFACAGFRAFGFDDDRAFVRHLIENVGVAAIPPSVFYDHPEHGRSYVRFAFCKKPETLERAVKRLEKLCA